MQPLTGYNACNLFTISEAVTVTGTVAVTNGSANVVGTGSNFTAWIVGDKILLPDTNWYTILTITDATHLAISVNYPGSNATGQTYNMQRINYPVKLTIYKSTGTNAANKLYAADQSLLWPTQAPWDFRFTESDGTSLLYHYRSYYDTTSGIWWITVDSLIAGTAFTGYVHVGNASATDGSDIANTFAAGDNFERGNDGDTVGGSWTETGAHCHISTTHFTEGSRGLKLVNNGSACTFPKTAVTIADYAINAMLYKETAAIYISPMNHGNGTKLCGMCVGRANANNIYYYTTSWQDSGVAVTPAAWNEIEIRNINFTAGTFDIWLNGAVAKSGAGMQTAAGYVNIIGTDLSTAAGVCWWDSFIIRKFRANEPTWSATWGGWEYYHPRVDSYSQILAQ